MNRRFLFALRVSYSNAIHSDEEHFGWGTDQGEALVDAMQRRSCAPDGEFIERIDVMGCRAGQGESIEQYISRCA